MLGIEECLDVDVLSALGFGIVERPDQCGNIRGRQPRVTLFKAGGMGDDDLGRGETSAVAPGDDQASIRTLGQSSFQRAGYLTRADGLAAMADLDHYASTLVPEGWDWMS